MALFNKGKMTYRILKTKLSIPPVKSQQVLRQRLNILLDSVYNHKLTLVSAPAGFGKTTALKEWIHTHAIDAAWISLDEGDNNASRFWNYMIACFQKINSEIGKSTFEIINSLSMTSFQSALTELLNELLEAKTDLILVLDDYHLIKNHQIHADLMFFIDNMPPAIRLIISTRTDPPMTMGRLRVLGELKEIRTNDLRFTSDETRSYLNEIMKLSLSKTEIEILEKRAEGWITGLQLAALSIQSGKDKKSFISSFKGSHSFVTTYLFEEVFLNQPEDIKTFLLKTSILERMTGELCDSVTDGNSSHSILQNLAAANLFIISLDDEGQYYRYHQLFSDFLGKQLLNTFPNDIPVLHDKASSWFEKNNFVHEAIHHALAANNLQKAASLIEGYGMRAFYHGKGAEIAGWIYKIPDSIIQSRPYLCIIQSMVLMSEKMPGFSKKVEQCLDTAETILLQSNNKKITENVDGQHDYSYMRATIETLRANLLREKCGLPERIMEASGRALNLTQDDYLELKCINLVNMVIGYLSKEDLKTAYHILDKNESITQCCDSHSFFILFRYFKAWIALTEGRLYEAASICRNTLDYIHGYEGNSETSEAVEGIIHICLGSVMLEWNKIAEAREELLMGIRLIEGIKSLRNILADGYASMTRLLMNENTEDRNFQYFIEKIKSFAPFLPGANEYAASFKIRFLLKQSKDNSIHLRSIEDLIKRNQLSIDGDISIADHRNGLKWKRAVQLSLIRFYIHQNILLSERPPAFIAHKAEQFLHDQIQHSEQKGQLLAVIEIRILQSLLYFSIGKSEMAMLELKKALAHGEPEDCIQLFVDEGEIMGKLLAEIIKKGGNIEYAGKLLRMIDKCNGRSKQPTKRLVTASPSYKLVEPLSKREVEVLRLISTGMSNQEAADKLFIARNTVKRHVSNIYGKLDVTSRIQAIHRAKENNII
ncbi:MAG: hypothetical protein C4522_05555 [Desulfobacteraceae bacterium]|nr:MAG: hypothetical protein C4522_05555 [Desulfobacteraceae bacterium]